MYFSNYGMLNPTFVPNKEEFGDMGCVSLQRCGDFDTLYLPYLLSNVCKRRTARVDECVCFSDRLSSAVMLASSLNVAQVRKHIISLGNKVVIMLFCPHRCSTAH